MWGQPRSTACPARLRSVLLDFADSQATRLVVFPDRNLTERLRVVGIPLTCVDNGMRSSVVTSASYGQTGRIRGRRLSDEHCTSAFQPFAPKRARRGALACHGTTVPKISWARAARAGRTISTRTFIPRAGARFQWGAWSRSASAPRSCPRAFGPRSRGARWRAAAFDRAPRSAPSGRGSNSTPR